MILCLLIFCNDRRGKYSQKIFLEESIANLAKGFLDVFITFGDMVAGAFGIKAETKKSEVGKYFSDIATTMETVQSKLQNEVEKNGNYKKVKEVVNEFITGILERIAQEQRKHQKGLQLILLLGMLNKMKTLILADATSVNALVKGIKEIVGVVLEEGEGNANATKTGDTEKKSVGKLLGTKDADGTEAQAAAASASIGAVSGADILRAIASSGEAGTSEIKIEQAKNAAEIAAAKKEANKDLGDSAKKDAIIAAGIALRGMAKDGKLAAKI